MDELGQRLIRDRERVEAMRREAGDLENRAARLRREADEIERIAELARFQR